MRVFFLDLIDDPGLIKDYEAWHQDVWPEVLDNLKEIGFSTCCIYRAGNRLVMIVESEKLVASDGSGGNVPVKVAQWEQLMDKYQQRLPFAKPNEKWVLADQIFSWSAIETQ